MLVLIFIYKKLVQLNSFTISADFSKYCYVSKIFRSIVTFQKYFNDIVVCKTYLLYMYKFECLIFRRNEICVRLFKCVVSTAYVVHNKM